MRGSPDEDGKPAEPPLLKTSVPNWQPGDAIPLGQARSLHVIDTRVEGDRLVLVVRDD